MGLLQERLAARFHQRQVQLLQAAQRATLAIGRQYRALAGPIAELASRVGLVGLASLRRRIDQLLDRARQAMENELTGLGILGYRTAAQAVLDALPAEWLPVFAGLASAKAKLPVQEATVLEPEKPPWQVRYEWAPVVQGAVRGEKAKQMVQALLFPPPMEEQVKAWLLAAPPGGMSWQNRLRRWEEPTRQAIFNDLVHGLVAGENVDGLRARLERWTDGLAYKAQRIARTEGCRAAERAGRDAFQSMGGMLQGLQIVAVMDEWTRPHHAARNGRIYWQGPDGLYRDERGELLPDLPDEPNCRCMTIPVLRPPPELAQNPSAMAAFQTATGQLIPDPASYQQWWQQASEREQMTAVGVKRWQAVRDLLQKEPIPRKPEWADFIDPQGRLLPMETLQAESPQERAQRRAKVDLLLAQREVLFQSVVSSGIPFPLQPGQPGNIFFQGPQALQQEIQRLAQEYRKHFVIPSEEKSRRRHFDRLVQKQILPTTEVRKELLRRAAVWEQLFQTAPKPTPAVPFPPHYQRQLAQALKQEEQQLRQQARQQFHRIMSLPPKYRTQFKIVPSNVPSSLNPVIQEAANFVGAMTHRAKLTQKRIDLQESPAVSPQGGVYYRSSKIEIHSPVPPETLVHELGHHVQHHVAGLHQAALQWRDKVSQVGKILWGGMDSKQTPWYYRERTDGKQWLSEYMGRVYFQQQPKLLIQGRLPPEDTSRHEVVAEGMKLLFQSPQRVAEQDPELFDLLLDHLRGATP